MSCSSGLAPHLHPAVGHSSVQVSAKELTGFYFWAGCVPMALLPLPHLPCSTVHHFLHSLGTFSLSSFEVSLLPFQSGCWNLPPVIICIYSLICILPHFNRRVFLKAALRELAKHLTAPSAPSPGSVKGIFHPDLTLKADSEQALQTTETLFLQDLVSPKGHASGCLWDMVAGLCLFSRRL